MIRIYEIVSTIDYDIVFPTNRQDVFISTLLLPMYSQRCAITYSDFDHENGIIERHKVVEIEEMSFEEKMNVLADFGFDKKLLFEAKLSPESFKIPTRGDCLTYELDPFPTMRRMEMYKRFYRAGVFDNYYYPLPELNRRHAAIYSKMVRKQ